MMHNIFLMCGSVLNFTFLSKDALLISSNAAHSAKLTQNTKQTGFEKIRHAFFEIIFIGLFSCRRTSQKGKKETNNYSCFSYLFVLSDSC